MSLARLMRSAGIVVRLLTAKQEKHSCLTACGKSPAAYCIFFWGGEKIKSMYVCMCVYGYICVYIHLYVSMYVYVGIYTCVYRYIDI